MVESSHKIALVFDMDNTLIGSRIDFAAIRGALIALLHRSGATAEPEAALRVRAIAQLLAIGTAHDEARGTALVPEMWRIIAAYEAEGLRDAAPIDGAAQVLDALRRRGHAIAVLTNNARAPSRAALHAAGLGGWLESLFAREDVPALKPAPDGVRTAIRHLGGADGAFVIGDSWIDGAAADGAGARFIAYRRTVDDLRPRGVVPWRTIAHLGELLDLTLTASG